MSLRPNSYFQNVLYSIWLINPRRACAARVSVLGLSFCLSVRPFVCLSVFCHYAQQGGQKAIPTGSVPHWLDFKNGDFRKSNVFKSYGMKTKQTSQYANKEAGRDSGKGSEKDSSDAAASLPFVLSEGPAPISAK